MILGNAISELSVAVYVSAAGGGFARPRKSFPKIKERQNHEERMDKMKHVRWYHSLTHLPDQKSKSTK